MDLDRASPIPLYFQIAQRLERLIVEGELRPGSRLENEIALADRLSVSRPTIRRAIQDLVDKGLVVRRRGIGTQVVHGRITRGIELTSLFDDLQRSGRKPETRVLEHRVTDADQRLAETLSVASGSPILHVRRLRLAAGTPIAIMENWLPAEFTDLSSADIQEHGLYQLLRARGVTIRVAKQRIGARIATDTEARQLGVQRNSALVTMDRTAFDSSGTAVEYGHHCYRSDLYSFEVTLVEK